MRLMDIFHFFRRQHAEAATLEEAYISSFFLHLVLLEN